MTDEPDDNVTRLPVRFKQPKPDSGPMLEVVHTRFGKGECDHRWRWVNGQMRSVSYAIRDGETEVECGQCGARLDPMWVLRRLATEETQWHETRRRYQEEMKRLSERSRTKCDHCGQMTRISKK